MSVKPDLSNHHQDFPRDVQYYEHAGETVVLTNAGEEQPKLYRVVDESRNPRVLGLGDMAIVDGTLVEFVWEDDHQWFVTCHPWAGIEEYFLPDEWLSTPGLRLERIEATTPRRDD